MIFVPIAAALAALVAAVTLIRSNWDLDPLVRHLLRPGLAFAVIGLYWLLVLVPASGDYVTNPASLAYRGPDRLWVDLFEHWPTAVVIVVGAAALAIAALRSVLLRRLDPLLLVAVWAGLAWGLLAWSLVIESATDFPRFATPLVAPLLVGSSAAVLWGLRSLASRVDAGRRGSATATIGVAIVLAVVITAPLTIERHVQQAEFYELRDAEALATASAWIEAELPEGTAVLADVREGKWIEGLSGLPALFNQPVRYAFRPGEWQRNADADALMRSTLTLTSGFVSAQFTGRSGSGADAVPTGLLVRANHGGEFVDVLRLTDGATSIDSDGHDVTAEDLAPVRAAHLTTERQASLRTVWERPGADGFAFTQTVTTYAEGTTVRLLQQAPGHRLTTVLSPAFGTRMTTLEISGSEAVACFRELGGTAPCIRISAAQPDARMRATSDGGLEVDSGSTSRIDLLVTALTAGDASVGLGLLEPTELVEKYDVGAALLYAADPSYRARQARLEALGFEEARSFGPYRVLLRGEEAGP
jgi:hypothetical protein